MEKVRVEAISIEIDGENIEFICEGGRIWAPREGVQKIFLGAKNDVLNALGEPKRFDKIFGSEASAVVDGRDYVSGEVLQFVLFIVHSTINGVDSVEDLRMSVAEELKREVAKWEKKEQSVQ